MKGMSRMRRIVIVAACTAMIGAAGIKAYAMSPESNQILDRLLAGYDRAARRADGMSQYRSPYGKAEVRWEMAKAGCTPEQIEEAVRASQTPVRMRGMLSGIVLTNLDINRSRNPGVHLARSAYAHMLGERDVSMPRRRVSCRINADQISYLDTRSPDATFTILWGQKRAAKFRYYEVLIIMGNVRAVERTLRDRTDFEEACMKLLIIIRSGEPRAVAIGDHGIPFSGRGQYYVLERANRPWRETDCEDVGNTLGVDESGRRWNERLRDQLGT